MVVVIVAVSSVLCSSSLVFLMMDGRWDLCVCESGIVDIIEMRLLTPQPM